MKAALFERFRELAYSEAGIDLKNGKETLVASRIAPRLRALGLAGEQAYLDHLKANAEELTQFLDVISTNFTHFFREPQHFDLLGSACQHAIASHAQTFTVWCAASSSGEEPWSIAMVLEDRFRHTDIEWKLLSTDISTRVLHAAQRGRYTKEAVAPVPQQLRDRYLKASGEGFVEVAEPLRERAKFARLNLARPPFPMKGPFDVIFCRNVMIYFDTRIRQGLVHQVERLLRPGGLFIVSHTETLHGVKTNLNSDRPSVYRKTGSPR